MSMILDAEDKRQYDKKADMITGTKFHYFFKDVCFNDTTVMERKATSTPHRAETKTKRTFADPHLYARYTKGRCGLGRGGLRFFSITVRPASING